MALLYLQASILLLTTVAAMALVSRGFAQGSRVIKGVVVGCDVLMWGMAFLGFVRAAVVWKVEERGAIGMGTQQRRQQYGTWKQ